MRNETERDYESQKETDMFNKKHNQAFEVKAQNILLVVTTEQVEKALGVSFEGQGKWLRYFSEDVLERVKSTHILIPGFPLSVNEMGKRVFDGEMLCEQTSVELRWFLLRRVPVKFGESIIAGEKIANIRDVLFAEKVLGHSLFDHADYNGKIVKCGDTWAPHCHCHTGLDGGRGWHAEHSDHSTHTDEYFMYIID